MTGRRAEHLHHRQRLPAAQLGHLRDTPRSQYSSTKQGVKLQRLAMLILLIGLHTIILALTSQHGHVHVFLCTSSLPTPSQSHICKYESGAGTEPTGVDIGGGFVLLEETSKV